MRCPFCASIDTHVKDSRPSDDSSIIRRRRLCQSCGGRFTTFERIQLRELTVLKSDGTKEVFDRDKIFKAMQISLRKRPIDSDKLETVINGIVRRLESMGESEIKSHDIGEMIMDSLAELDQVAYVRFASVYRDFGDAKDFGEFIQALAKKEA